MTPSFDGMLAVGIVGFYLWDSAMLLYRNEMVFAKGNERWAFACPDSRWHILGKILYLPNPFFPHNPLFRVIWSVTADNEHPDCEAEQVRFYDALKPLGRMVIVLQSVLLIGLPLALFAFGSGERLLVLFGAIYLIILGMLTLTYCRREELGLSGRVFIKLAFDSLACPPFAVNLVRKIALRRSVGGAPIEFARHVFDDATFVRLVGRMCIRIDEELEIECEESPRFIALKAFRARIASMAQ